ncbi:MAG: amino acid permease [Deltaproteobacteria bacterium]|nr:amino acid permease [Deltaproteobacteria bacterium]
MAEKVARSLSLFGAVATIVGLVVGASIFILIPGLAGMCGPSLWLAYLLSSIPAIFAVLYLIQLGAALPVTGANYIAVTRWLSPMAGFSGSMVTLVAIVSTNCIVAWGFAQYLTDMFPLIPPLLIAIGIILLFGLINWMGVKAFEFVQIIMFLAFIVAMVMFGVGGTIHADPALIRPLFPNGVRSFFFAVAIANFSWGGLIVIAEVAGEIKNPRRNIPLALIISLLLILVLYVLQTFALTATMSWKEAGNIGATAVIDAAHRFLPSWAVGYLWISALLAMATSVNAIMMLAAREALVLSRDKILPHFLSRINPRFKTPEGALLFITVLSLAGVLVSADLERYALIVVLALMVLQMLGASAVFRMPRVAADIYEKAEIRFNRFWQAFTWVGCMVLFGGIFVFSFQEDPKTGLIFIGIYALGFVYWQVRKAHLKKRNIDIEKELKKISEVTLLEMES